MSDASVNTLQSVVATASAKVERCKYRHDWTINPELGGERNIVCRQCGVLPKARDIQEAEAIVHLRSVLKPGETVYTVLRHVSRSGMSRGIDVYRMDGSTPVWITGYVGHAIGSPQSRKDWERSQGLRVGGCGMDMGFHVVNSLSYVIFPEYRCLGKDGHCPSGYHVNHRDTVQCEGLPTYRVYYRNADGIVEKLPEVYQTREQAEARAAILGEGARLPDGDSVSCDYLHCWQSDTVQLPDIQVALSECQNCGKQWSESEIKPIDRVGERVAPGEPMPSGECPECGAVCHEGEPISIPQGKARTITYEDGTEVICPVCKGHGRYPNPEGTERWDLVHKDGYALRHKWL